MATPRQVSKERTAEDRFKSAVSVIHSLPKDGPYQPSNMIKLKFYGLYKQAKQGPNTTPKPGFWDPTARAKWEAWTLCGDMGTTQAMNMYVRELEQLVETMPQTREVEQFLQMIGPFYEVVEDNSGGGVVDTEGGDSGGEVIGTEGGDRGGGVIDTEGGRGGGVIDTEGGDRGDEDTDSEGGDSGQEYEDSYDALPETTPTSKPPLIRRDTPYFKQLAPVAVDTDTVDTVTMDTSLKETARDKRERGVTFSDTVTIRSDPTINNSDSSMEQVLTILHEIQQSLQVINTRLPTSPLYIRTDWRGVVFCLVNIIALGIIERSSHSTIWWQRCIRYIAIACNAWLMIGKLQRLFK